MAEFVDLTPELLAKLGPAIAEAAVRTGTGADAAAVLRRHGIGVVDLDRQRCVIDERVYEGALFRARRWERLALPFLSPLLPAETTWQELSKRSRS
jgi:hypothetical protein